MISASTQHLDSPKASAWNVTNSLRRLVETASGLVDIFPKGNTMSKAMADTPKRRARQQFTDEFKTSAVRLVLDEGKTVSAAARDLDLTETALREWVRRAHADRTK